MFAPLLLGNILTDFRIVPTVKRNDAHSAMAIAFLAGLLKEGMPVPTADIDKLYKDLFPALAHQFMLEKALPAKLWDNKFERYGVQKAGAALVRVLLYCMKLGLAREVGQLLSNLASGADKMWIEIRQPLRCFDWFFLPFLKSLAEMLEANCTGVLDSPFQQLFQRILSTFVVRYVRTEPKPQKD